MIRAGGASLTGMRDENQDRYLASVSEDGRRAVGAVADGVGGLPDGAGAATVAIEAVEAFRDWLFEASSPGSAELKDRVAQLYRDANRAVIERSGSGGRSGTTLVMVAVTESCRVVANVGDSRAYRMKGQDLQGLTEDHTVVQERVREGLLTPEQAEQSPYKHILTRSLGEPGDPDVDVDVRDRSDSDGPPGSALVLSSDGVHDVPGFLTGGRVRAALDAEGDPDAAAERICRAAVDAGSRDNATLVLLL